MVEGINALEADMQKLSDEALRARTDEFRQRRAAGESLEALLPEGRVRATKNADDVAPALGALRDDDCDTIAIVGGDGTLNGTLTPDRTIQGNQTQINNPRDLYVHE